MPKVTIRALAEAVAKHLSGGPTKLARAPVGRKYTLRFNLKAGPQNGHWELTDTETGERTYHDPATTRFVLTGAKLVNERGHAERIHAGADKNRVAWIEAEDVRRAAPAIEPPPGTQVRYNPRVVPFWHDEAQTDLDGTEHPVIVTHQRGVFSVGEKPTKLARHPDPTTHDALIDGAKRTQDPHALGVIADHLDEHGLPGASLFRLAHKQGRGHDTNLMAYQMGLHPSDNYFSRQWIDETGQDSYDWVPHSTEVYPTWAHDRLYLGVSHTGTDDQPLRFSVHIPDAPTLHHALSSLPDAQRTAVVKLLKRVRRSRDVGQRPPFKLARTLAYVGDPSGPAFGFWDGGHERSRIIPAGDASEAETIARGHGEHTAVWFTPGDGDDTLHVIASPGTPEAVKSVLVRHGISNMTLVHRGSGTVAHIVDQGSELGDAAEAAATDLKGRYKAIPGTAGFSVL